MPGELTLQEIEKLAGELSSFGLKHIVYSGGEPLLRKDFGQICEIFKQFGVKQTVLTNGLLLEKKIDDLVIYFTEIIVSIDGADAETHNSIRGINSFDSILRGIKKTTDVRGFKNISIRSVVQKRNFRQFPEMIELAKSSGVSRISFLSADVFSESFGRDTRGYMEKNENILLNESEVKEFRSIIENTIEKYGVDFNNKFISESPEKIYRILEYYEACIGMRDYPGNTCNAPMVSAVITSTGDILPCYFLPVFGNVRNSTVSQLLNNDVIKRNRKEVKDYVLDRCKQCVCTLNISSRNALLNKF
jgi:MoaA/NifB/PqqE/SkfB family radical SAM enzyme